MELILFIFIRAGRQEKWAETVELDDPLLWQYPLSLLRQPFAENGTRRTRRLIRP